MRKNNALLFAKGGVSDTTCCHDFWAAERVMADMDKDDDKIRMLQEKTTLFMITAEAKFEKTKINFEMNF